MTESTVNIHNRVIKIADDLYIAGFGGSVSSVDRMKNVIWAGYPKVKGDLDVSGLKKAIRQLPKTSSVWKYTYSYMKLIIMTHTPPMIAPSSIMYTDKLDKKIYAGSRQLDSLVNTSLMHVPLLRSVTARWTFLSFSMGTATIVLHPTCIIVSLEARTFWPRELSKS